MWRDLERICRAQGIPFRRPSAFPRNGLLAARVACWFSEELWLPSFVKAIYRANFEEDQDISSLVGHCLAFAGENPETLLAEAQSSESKARLRSQTEAAIQRGVFGAPSFLVGRELFWGASFLSRYMKVEAGYTFLIYYSLGYYFYTMLVAGIIFLVVLVC